jgi:hypothetical protein
MNSNQSFFRGLVNIGLSLSSQKNQARLMDTILRDAWSIGHADAGTF